jgi:hypothetical protein
MIIKLNLKIKVKASLLFLKRKGIRKERLVDS